MARGIAGVAVVLLLAAAFARTTADTNSDDG
jgi:hypothetical protein